MFYVNLILIVLLIVLSAFFAGSETGVYRLSRIRVRIGQEQAKRSYKILFKLLKDGQGLILTLLLGNNLVNYSLTSLVTLMILATIDNPNMAETYATLLITPVLFVFGELIPKNILYFQADSWLPRFAWIIWTLDKAFTLTGAKFLLKKLSHLTCSILGLNVDTSKALDATQRHQVHQIIRETQEEGLLSQSQRDMMTRLIDFPTMPVSSVMIGLKDVHRIPVSITRPAFIDHLKASRFTRRLVYESESHNILGYVSIYEVLDLPQDFQTLKELVRPLVKVDKDASVIEAINLLRNHQERVALVVETHKKEVRPVGMITITDLVEEITGELNL